MICHKCRKEIAEDAKFCKFCGNEAVAINQAQTGSVDLYFKKKDNSCQVCGAYAPVKYVEFYQNIGMLVTREYKYVKGRLCKKCIDQTFWKFTLTTLAVGWLGAISLIIAPLIIINNIFRYLLTLGLPKE